MTVLWTAHGRIHTRLYTPGDAKVKHLGPCPYCGLLVELFRKPTYQRLEPIGRHLVGCVGCAPRPPRPGVALA